MTLHREAAILFDPIFPRKLPHPFEKLIKGSGRKTAQNDLYSLAGAEPEVGIHQRLLIAAKKDSTVFTFNFLRSDPFEFLSNQGFQPEKAGNATSDIFHKFLAFALVLLILA
jgi:hypothetical protein